MFKISSGCIDIRIRKFKFVENSSKKIVRLEYCKTLICIVKMFFLEL